MKVTEDTHVANHGYGGFQKATLVSPEAVTKVMKYSSGELLGSCRTQCAFV